MLYKLARRSIVYYDLQFARQCVYLSLINKFAAAVRDINNFAEHLYATGHKGTTLR